MSDSKTLEKWAVKARRKAVCTRTLDRWAEAGIIKKPVIINGRKYGERDDEPRCDDTEAA
jgi:hypothetical protein